MIGALDIGGTKIAAGAVSRSGSLLRRTEFPTVPASGPERGLANMIRALQTICGEAGQSLEGIGIGCTGPVDPLTGRLGAIPTLPGWDGLGLVEEVHKAFEVPVAMENDADAAALGESVHGAGLGAERFLYITVGTGIGGGIILDGRIYRGAGGSHPEFGHQVIEASGPECTCGARGCWEALASGPALARRGTCDTGQAVCEAARGGDPAARLAVEQEGFYLGLGLANLITLFVPDVIALGGGVMRSADLFRDKIVATIQDICRLVPHERTSLVTATLGAEAGLGGQVDGFPRFGELPGLQLRRHDHVVRRVL